MRRPIQDILSEWALLSEDEGTLLEVQTYQAEWDRLKNRRNLPRVRRARRQFRKRLNQAYVAFFRSQGGFSNFSFKVKIKGIKGK